MWRGSSSFAETWRFSDIDFGPQTVRFPLDVLSIFGVVGFGIT
jgi:hypothetical protein